MNRTPSHICTHFILVHMHRMGQGVARRVLIKERSSTCHHVSDRALSLHPLFRVPLQICQLFEPPSTKSTAHPQNEEDAADDVPVPQRVYVTCQDLERFWMHSELSHDVCRCSEKSQDKGTHRETELKDETMDNQFFEDTELTLTVHRVLARRVPRDTLAFYG